MRATALRTYRELLQAAWVREVPVGPVDETLARVGRILRDAKIPFAVAGGFAVSEHGYERFTRGAGARGTETSAATPPLSTRNGAVKGYGASAAGPWASP